MCAAFLAGRRREVDDRLTGAAEAADLSAVLSVQVGRETERLNLDWLHRRVEGSSFYRVPAASMVAGEVGRIGGHCIVSRRMYRAKADGFRTPT